MSDSSANTTEFFDELRVKRINFLLTCSPRPSTTLTIRQAFSERSWSWETGYRIRTQGPLHWATPGSKGVARLLGPNIETKTNLSRGLTNLWTSRCPSLMGCFKKINAFLAFFICFHKTVHNKCSLDKIEAIKHIDPNDPYCKRICY